MAELTARHKEYWSKNLTLTGILLAIWLFATFVLMYFAREIEGINFFGWPLPFYMAAQGSLVFFVVMLFLFAKRQDVIDREEGVAEDM